MKEKIGYYLNPIGHKEEDGYGKTHNNQLSMLKKSYGRLRLRLRTNVAEVNGVVVPIEVPMNRLYWKQRLFQPKMKLETSVNDHADLFNPIATMTGVSEKIQGHASSLLPSYSHTRVH